MPRKLAALLGAIILFSSCDLDRGSLVDPFTGKRHENPVYSAEIARKAIVVLNEHVKAPEVAREHGVALDLTYSAVFNGFVGEVSEAARSGLMRDSRVVGVYRDAEVRHQQAGVPWGLDRIDQRATGLDGQFTSAATGEGVTIYIVDSGIRYAHSEFGGRAVPGFDVYGAGGEDCNGHGTHVAATAGGRTYGVAKNVRLVSVKVLGCSASGSVSLMIAGLDWILANASGPSVVNMSIAAPAYELMDRAVQRLTRAGIVVVVAAANYNADACNYSPAGEPTALTVGATTPGDARAAYSNWGRCVDLFAPGSDIMSADVSSDLASSVKSGTSMASPHVAGVAALYLQHNPAATAAEVHDALKANATGGVVTSANSPNNNLLFAGSSEWIAPPAPSAAFELNGATSKQKSLKFIQLSWAGASGSTVVVMLNGAVRARVANSGAWSYTTLSKSRTSYEFQVCEAEGEQRCSNRWVVTL